MRIFTLVTCATLFAFAAAAEETAVDVRVIAKGAKFIGSSMGGVAITIRDAHTGELLAEGVTKGSTGDTELIMNEEQRHHAPVSTEDAAVYHVTLDLDAPRFVEIAARGPLAQPQAIVEASVEQWIVPGKDITGGDGVLLELPGFVVDILAPPAHQKLPADTQQVTLRANVALMCGCPVAPAGLWDAEQYELAVLLERDGEPAGEHALQYAGETSQFETTLEIAQPGTYIAAVYAYDPATGNTGLDRTSFIVPAE